MKLKRRVVVQKYDAEIEAMYQDPPPAAAQPKPAEPAKQEGEGTKGEEAAKEEGAGEETKGEEPPKEDGGVKNKEGEELSKV